MIENNNKNSETVTLNIEGMTCDHCAVSIGKRFDRKKGIIAKDVLYNKKRGEFTFNPSLISKQEIIDTINSSKTYRVVGSVPENGDRKNHFDLIIIGGG